LAKALLSSVTRSILADWPVRLAVRIASRIAIGWGLIYQLKNPLVLKTGREGTSFGAVRKRFEIQVHDDVRRTVPVDHDPISLTAHINGSALSHGFLPG
jgi:hypothetical protein